MHGNVRRRAGKNKIQQSRQVEAMGTRVCVRDTGTPLTKHGIKPLATSLALG